MTLSLKGAALLCVALVSVAPLAAAADDMAAGAAIAVPAQTTSTQSLNESLAMLVSPLPLDDSGSATDGSIQQICHRSAEGCTSSSTTNSLSIPLLSFPPARGKVIFQHSWASGDIPSSFETPGGGKAGTFFARRKFRLPTNADGRYKIVTDPQTGAKVLDILVTAQDEARTRTHHTEVEVNIPDYWTKGRFMVQGQRYLVEYWRKNVNYSTDSVWEIWWQIHAGFDNSAEQRRNPTVAIGGGRRGDIQLNVRADSNAISKKVNGVWSFTRDSSYSIGSPNSSAWELWQMEIVVDYRHGALHLWRNGQLIHSEEGLPIGYNDKMGPPCEFGWYKYFKNSSVDRRQAYFGPVRVQKL